jgi:hypothetical protein
LLYIPFLSRPDALLRELVMIELQFCFAGRQRGMDPIAPIQWNNHQILLCVLSEIRYDIHIIELLLSAFSTERIINQSHSTCFETRSAIPDDPSCARICSALGHFLGIFSRKVDIGRKMEMLVKRHAKSE